MFAMPREFRLRERAGYDATELGDVAHVNDAPLGIDRQRPTHGTVRLFLRSHCAQEVLVIKRRYHEGVIGKSGVAYGALDFRLVGEMRDLNLAVTYGLHIGQRRPDEVLDTGVLRRPHRRDCLLGLVGSGFPGIRYYKDSV